MKNFDKKILIIIFLIITIFLSLYFFMKDDTDEILYTNDFYISTNTSEVSEQIKEMIIHIDGEVINPGLVYLPMGSRISDAISAAGGLTEIADTSKINLAYELKDAQKIYIPSIYDAEINYIQNDAGNNVIVPDASSNSSLININSASQAELETLPGVGASTAKKIIDYRTKNGKFQTIEDIMNVSGIGEAKFNNLKDYICT